MLNNLNNNKNNPANKKAVNINKSKTSFSTKIRILKSFKEKGQEVNLNTYIKIFELEKYEDFIYKIASFKDTKNRIKEDKTFNIKKQFQKTKNDNNKKDKLQNKEEKLLEKKKYSNTLLITAMSALVSIAMSFVLFSFCNDIKFTKLDEDNLNIILRSLKSPQTETFLKSRFDEKRNSIIYYYKVNDMLDSYTYEVSNQEVNEKLRSELLKSSVSDAKTIKSINTLNPDTFNTIVLHEDYYVINNKYKIHEKNITGEQISSITNHIKENNIKNHKNLKFKFIGGFSVALTLIITFSTIFISSRIQPNKRDA